MAKHSRNHIKLSAIFKRSQPLQVIANSKEGEFEVVPQEPSDSEDSSASDMEEPNPEDAAEIRAVAKAMLKGRTKNDMIEDGYHRYAFHDVGLPRWFAEDEQKHMRCTSDTDICAVSKQRWNAYYKGVSS